MNMFLFSFQICDVHVHVFSFYVPSEIVTVLLPSALLNGLSLDTLMLAHLLFKEKQTKNITVLLYSLYCCHSYTSLGEKNQYSRLLLTLESQGQFHYFLGD